MNKLTPLFCERLFERETEHFPFTGEEIGKERSNFCFRFLWKRAVRLWRTEGFRLRINIFSGSNKNQFVLSNQLLWFSRQGTALTKTVLAIR